MTLSKKWGQGQIFAFSALNGNSFFGDDFCGTLSADRIGIRFLTKIRRELALVNGKFFNVEFDAVTGDYISCIINNDKHMKILFYKPHIIIGKVCENAVPVVFTEGRHTIYTDGNLEIQDSGDGEFTALITDGENFAFSFGHSSEEAAALAKEGIKADFSEAEKNKLECYEKKSVNAPEEYAELYSKCVSVMKTQLYTPEGRFKQTWSTPNRTPHRRLWLWDSVFHAIGHRNLNPEIAEDLILSVLDTQDANGFIPHMADINIKSDITQPPVIAWGAYKVFEKSNNKKFLERIFEANEKFLEWCAQNRRKSDEDLYVWYTDDNNLCRCGESGMDNSPRFDVPDFLQAIDFSCFAANEMRYMSKIAKILGYSEKEKFYSEKYLASKEIINKKLWDEDDGFYYDYDMQKNQLHKIMSVASFLPLFAGVCTPEHASRLKEKLCSANHFATPFPVPSISKTDSTFGSDMWRGPVWINYNYMIADGLDEYNYSELANLIREKTIEYVNEWYQKTGTIYEFYDSEDKSAPSQLNRKGKPIEPYNPSIRYQSIRDYGWSCTLVCDLLARKYSTK